MIVNRLKKITAIWRVYKIKFVPLCCVFHSIRFKVNKVGVQRYSIFFALKFVP